MSACERRSYKIDYFLFLFFFLCYLKICIVDDNEEKIEKRPSGLWFIAYPVAHPTHWMWFQMLTSKCSSLPFVFIPTFIFYQIFNFSWFFHFLFLLLSYLLLLFSHWFLFHALFLDCLSWELSRSGQPLFFLSFLLSWFFPNMLLALWMLYSLILLLATCNMFMQVFVSFGALSFKN